VSLSDVCFDFLAEVKDAKSDDDRREAVRNLQGAIDFYDRPPFRYGDEIEVLRYACSEYLLSAPPASTIDEPLKRLAFVCGAIQENLDLPPGFKVPVS
jgi:hypothetical protein